MGEVTAEGSPVDLPDDVEFRLHCCVTDGRGNRVVWSVRLEDLPPLPPGQWFYTAEDLQLAFDAGAPGEIVPEGVA